MNQTLSFDFLKCSKLRKKYLVYQKGVCFLFQQRTIDEKIRRFILGKFMKTCCELDNRRYAQKGIIGNSKRY